MYIVQRAVLLIIIIIIIITSCGAGHNKPHPLCHLATSDAKADVIFLLGDPDFLLGGRNFAPISLSYRDPHFGGFGGVLGRPVYPN